MPIVVNHIFTTVCTPSMSPLTSAYRDTVPIPSSSVAPGQTSSTPTPTQSTSVPQTTSAPFLLGYPMSTSSEAPRRFPLSLSSNGPGRCSTVVASGSHPGHSQSLAWFPGPARSGGSSRRSMAHGSQTFPVAVVILGEAVSKV